MTMRRTRHSSVSYNARRTRILHGIWPSLKCVDTRHACFLDSDPSISYISYKYADLSEYGYGVAILSESKYGFSCIGNVLRISLLRGATAPDAEQDQGTIPS